MLSNLHQQKSNCSTVISGKNPLALSTMKASKSVATTLNFCGRVSLSKFSLTVAPAPKETML